ncbi:MAG TPA: N-6 DNA methylase [Vicinamibacterales bacterium]|nr:N-6 DNA methylase [Vicinamibacterales bacterium]
MTTVSAGISGNLFPGRYLAERLAGGHFPSDDGWAHRRLQFERWWTRVERSSGPASGLRAVFDVVAMPLFAMLGFRARQARFESRHATAQLLTPSGRPVGLVLLPWAERPSALWREPCAIARAIGAAWCFLFAPPFLAIVDVRAHALRKSIELTLPDIFDTSVFAVFWTLARATAFDAPAEGPAAESRLDVFVRAATIFQDRVRDDLQHGVAEALVEFGRALGPRPPERSTNASSVTSRFDEALTLVYRVLFLLFAESRGLVPHGVPVYRDAYTVGALCRQALAGRDAPGVWDGLAAITRLLRVGCRTSDLRVKPFNGRLFARASAPTLERGRSMPRRTPVAVARDRAAARALTALGSRPTRHGRETIAYADLGVEQLGAVYERVLDIDPQALDALQLDEHGAAALDVLRQRRGRGQHSARRKTTGTFYTPQPLADFVARRTLAPLVAGGSPDAILRLRVVDPAMGSGAFLVAACRYLAGAYERAFIEHGEATPADFDADARAGVRRLVAERCLVGVDRNPVAVQVARLSMWLATLARGRPLGFLDHRLRVGDSLIGASPDDLRRITTSTARGHGALPLFDDVLLDHAIRDAARPLAMLHDRREDTVDDVRAKEAAWADLTSASSPLEPWRRAADLWCARWFWLTGDAPPSPPELRALIDAVLRRDRTLASAHVSDRLATARAIASAHRFFHWPIEMSDVFYDDDGLPRARPGFDAVLANPPWEMLRGDATDDGDAHPSAREDAISSDDRRGTTRFIRESGIYSSCDRGHLNVYQPFLERALSLAREGGRVGLIVPWSLATDDGAAALRRRLLDRSTLHTLVGLDNANGLFPIHRGFRFMVMVASPGGSTGEIRARFGVKTAAEIEALPDREDGLAPTAYPVRLTRRQIEAVSGPALRIPDVRDSRDLQLAERLCRQFPALGDAAGWNASFGRELNATEDRGSFGPRGLPVIQGRHLTPFRVDAAAPDARIAPETARRLLPAAPFAHRRLGYRDVSGVGNRLSLIAAIVPAGVVTTHTIFCLRAQPDAVGVDDELLDFLCGLLNSYVLNAIVRLLMGSHVTTTIVERLPAPVWTGEAAQRRVARLARRLSTAWSARAHARLQADVAAIFGLDAAELERVVSGFPLIDVNERALAVRMRALMERKAQRHVRHDSGAS